MIKWIAGFLVVLFVGLMLVTISSQVADSWRAHQNAMIAMEENLATQSKKRSETAERIALIQSKPELDDHDRWLIDHLSKTLAGLDKALLTIDAGQELLHRSLLRTWVGNTVLLLTLLIFGLGMLVRPAKILTAEEKRWLTSDPKTIPGLTFSPSSFRKTIAPTQNSSNFVTGRVKAVNKNVLKVTNSGILRRMALMFIIAPQGGLIMEIYFLVGDLFVEPIPFSQLQWDNIARSLLLSIPFTLVGLYLLASGTSNAQLDRNQQRIIFPGNKENLSFKDVESIQLNEFLTTGKRSYINSQIQLNLRNGDCLSLLSHAGKDHIYVDLIRTALFMKKPVVLPES
ncbi:hypothetical protein BGP77_15375 [Saccharospirillum sp. MSK14-1]|uniref:hypothetical protein n=1 Tax=Saccharospirillum sp. MSK14-1 TaxID=1897632 RepID=UPI000D434BF5|nr:hypothetical protein [Saccharospirillum sp. MSK14-1]PTY37851.1 hypothetical protein BGP77_15375 [Saccharospirillum sp. MSK14-1]